ncbi:MAG: FKBP-type peptidyl-prolyl cis-trans isomerase [Nitrospirota bacterium]
MRRALMLASILLFLARPSSAADPLIVEEGNDVSIEYTLSTKDGEIINSNVGGDPFTYRQGSKSLECMAGLQKRLAGHQAGEKLSLLLTPDEACGPVNPAAIIELELDLIPKHARKVGQRIKTMGPHGTELSGVIKEVKERSVILDVNHPLAGQTLRFDVKIVQITKREPDQFMVPRPPTPH